MNVNVSELYERWTFFFLLVFDKLFTQFDALSTHVLIRWSVLYLHFLRLLWWRKKIFICIFRSIEKEKCVSFIFSWLALCIQSWFTHWGQVNEIISIRFTELITKKEIWQHSPKWMLFIQCNDRKEIKEMNKKNTLKSPLFLHLIDFEKEGVLSLDSFFHQR